MDWLSRCVCGSKESGNFEKNKKKKKRRKDKVGELKKNEDKYVISDDKDVINNEKKSTLSCVNAYQNDEGLQVITNVENNDQKQVFQDTTNQVDQQIQFSGLNYGGASEADVNLSVIHITENDDLEFYDSLSDTTPEDSLRKNSLKECKSSYSCNKNKDFEFNQVVENCEKEEEKSFRSWSSKIVKSSSENNNFYANSKSCSFSVPIFDDDDDRCKRKKIQNRKVKSLIPKASPEKQRQNNQSYNDSSNRNNKNGRVHGAIVSGVNWDQRSVTVEWFEKGETKGKEVEIDAILALNPELTSKSMPPPPQINMSVTRSRDSSDEEDDAADDLDNQEDGSLGRHGGHTTRNGLTSATLSHAPRQSIPVKASSNRQRNQPGRPTSILPPSVTSVNGQNETMTALTSRREVENIPPTPTIPAFTNISTTSTNKTKQNQSSQPQQQQPIQPPTTVENGRGRRSNVVKEVERLKKNREERRQRQAELKEEKEALMNMDPGNPNWEFLAMIREYQNSIEFRPLRESDAVEDHQITVCVRKRPLNRKEQNRKEVDVISVPSKDQMIVHEPKLKVDLTKYLENQHFRFDYAFDETCNNEIVYKYTAKPLVQTIFEGGMATCFAYGQTGSGKTHTMGGDFNGKTQDCKKGIYAMAAKDVFKLLKSAKYRVLNLVISASFFEIYSGKVFDLLADKEKLRVLEDGKQQVQIVGLTEKVVESVDEVLKLIQHGNSARTSGQTSANTNSSRSHAVFQIIARTPGTHKVHGKFSLIDLAGNERGADTSSANRQTRMEGAEINKSLLALKECIRALGRKDRGTHLPFRASKLTQVLRDSFIGEKSKTCMIAMISPGMSSCEHSLNTLRYADRVKELAATDPTELRASPTGEERLAQIDEQANDSVLSDSDLAQLRSLNEGELSEDLYTFHEAVTALQTMEEEVLDTHKLVIDNTNKFLNEAHQVFSATYEVDYDQEAYAKKWEELLLQQRDTITEALDQVSQFRVKLMQEEQMSQQITRLVNPRYN
ncbi:kinesin-like protein KIF2A isoform X2 [Chelonus insularis]|uniref:kinesin-like protein KIF2A isoform X2 n=1 Tax=Chelonus insularis TaxID=460826 RepID=UPI00158E3E33|nr:kinesin-like protein KIF2A isoform X2 [Chelonus insularis]